MDVSVVNAKEAGRKLPRLLNRLSDEEKPYYITDDDGRAKAVLLDVDRYNAMMDALEEDQTGGPDAAVATQLLKAILGRSRKS